MAQEGPINAGSVWLAPGVAAVSPLLLADGMDPDLWDT